MKQALIVIALSLLSVLGFSPKFGIRRRKSLPPCQSLPDPIDTLTSGLASICRLPGGVTVTESALKVPEEKRPVLKQLYDVENSQECRKVREKVTEVDLVVEKVIPAASNSRVFTDNKYEYYLPPGTEIPRLILETKDGELMLSGSEEITSYLDETFGIPAPSEEDTKEQIIVILREIGGYVATVLRIGRGRKVSPAAGKTAPRPEKPLVLYSYEGNQFCRLVREVLTELDIVYELKSAGKMSPRREELAELTGGSTQCPYLVDPNTGKAMAESADIMLYLYKNYALWVPPNELLQWASDVILPAAKPLFKALAPLQAGSNSEDEAAYKADIAKAKAEIEVEIQKGPVVVYTYGLSPFSTETKALLGNLDIEYEEISLGLEWIPGLIAEGGAQKRAALLEMTGQSSLPQIFIGGKSIGGLFSGSPGLLPGLEEGVIQSMVADAMRQSKESAPIQSDSSGEATAGVFE